MGSEGLGVEFEVDNHIVGVGTLVEVERFQGVYKLFFEYYDPHNRELPFSKNFKKKERKKEKNTLGSNFISQPGGKPGDEGKGEGTGVVTCGVTMWTFPNPEVRLTGTGEV